MRDARMGGKVRVQHTTVHTFMRDCWARKPATQFPARRCRGRQRAYAQLSRAQQSAGKRREGAGGIDATACQPLDAPQSTKIARTPHAPMRFFSKNS